LAFINARIIFPLAVVLVAAVWLPTPALAQALQPLNGRYPPAYSSKTSQ